MNIWDRRAAQAENERNGIKVRFDQYPGIVITVRPLCDWNDDLQRARVALATRADVRDFLKRIADKDYEPSEADKRFDREIEIETFVRGCVVGWEGVPAPDGGPFAFNVPNCCEFFRHFPDVYTAARRSALNLSNFRQPTEDDVRRKVAGNSKRASRTK